jgi:predicted nucleic acid-binding protein
MANPIVCLDTHIFSFALGSSSPGEDSARLAKDFLRWIDKQKLPIIVPTVVVSELLVAIPKEHHHSFLSKFSASWRVVEFDMLCAAQLAAIRRDEVIKKRLKQLMENGNPGATKAALNVDAMIVATSIVHNVDTLYSYDKRLLALAKTCKVTAKRPEEEEFPLSMLSEDD